MTLNLSFGVRWPPKYPQTSRWILAGGYRRDTGALRFICRPALSLGDKKKRGRDLSLSGHGCSLLNLRREGQSVVGTTVESRYFLGNYCFAQFNELEQLGSQFTPFHFPVEAVSSPSNDIIAQAY